MEYFFIRKDEHFAGGDEYFIPHPTKEVRRNLIVICDKETLKITIQKNHISKFRKIKPFRKGSVVRLRKSAKQHPYFILPDELIGQIVTITSLDLDNHSRFNFNDNPTELMVDSIDEVIKH